MPIPVTVVVGIGAWTAHATTKLIACPHIGDTIEVKGHTVTCERVHITDVSVHVEQTIRFQSQEQADTFFEE